MYNVQCSITTMIDVIVRNRMSTLTYDAEAIFFVDFPSAQITVITKSDDRGYNQSNINLES
jgi:hypothetical protein